MKLKTKLIASIMSICLVCAVFAIGVFALKTANLKIGGDVTFNANGIVADVEFVSLTGHDTTNSTLNTFEKVTLDNNTPGSAVQAKMATWQNLDIKFAQSGEDVVLKFKVTNKMDDKLSIKISPPETQNSNIIISTSEQTSSIAANDTTPKEYTITFSVDNKELNASLEDFELNIKLVKGDLPVVTIGAIKIGDSVAQEFGEEVKANQAVTHIYNKGTISIPAGGQVAIKTTLSSQTSNYAKVNLSYNNMSTAQPKLLIRGTSLFLDPEKDSQNYYIYLINTDTTNAISNLNLEDLGLNISIDDSYTSLLQYDEINSYYYVEMGTLPNLTNTASEYIRWRYISEDGQTRFTGTEAPSSLKGTYILETDTQFATRPFNPDDPFGPDGRIENAETLRNDGESLLSISFQNNYSQSTHKCLENTNIDSRDYALSTVRKYINGTSVYKSASGEQIGSYEIEGYHEPIYKYIPDTSSHYSNMYVDLCINIEEDVVYNKISARTLEDLYEDVLINVPEDEKSNYAPANGVDMSQTDKFWLISGQEALNLFGDSSWDYFWLRSATYDLPKDSSAFWQGGYVDMISSQYPYPAARACFNLG